MAHKRAPDRDETYPAARTRTSARSREHDRQRKAIVTLAANRLNRRRRHTRLPGEHLVEPANPAHAGVDAGGVKDFAAAHDVVRDDHGARAGEAQRPGEII